MPNLCTLASFKTAYGITGTSEDDAINQLIAAQSQAFMNDIKRPDFAPSAAFTEYLEGNDRCFIYLWHYPVNTITSLIVNGTTIPEWSDSTPDTLGYVFDATIPPEDRMKIWLRGAGNIFPRACWPGYRGIIVAGTAGYGTIPDDVAQAVREWVAIKRGNSQLQATNQSTPSITIGDYSQGGVATETAKALTSELPDSIQSVIDNYTRPQI